ncbi:sce7726 family protein [uncultured Bacteroides sp.]|uniref:sce7726 family protein n=1 Tax=uncultured Bacteroides sp. TaxID=162156 RepID=UPI002AAAE3DE|nr:sce7726 family protein [uncultured Bacteroides sp.]
MKMNDTNIYRFRSYANMFGRSVFSTFVEEQNMTYISSKINKYDKECNFTFREYYTYIYKILLSNYRNEYIYKNLIINKILLGKHSLNTSTILNEFRIGKSIADLVFLNGTSKVFEIKTELDNLSRFNSQVNDYRKVFKQIYIVTHVSLADKFSQTIGDNVGIIVLTKNKTLKIVREALEDMTFFDPVAMFKCLRKVEYTNVINSFYGEIPQVKAVNYYSVCKELFIKIPLEELHSLMLKELKKRCVKEKELFASVVPEELKLLFWNLNYGKKEYEKFTQIIDKNVLEFNTK